MKQIKAVRFHPPTKDGFQQIHVPDDAQWLDVQFSGEDLVLFFTTSETFPHPGSEQFNGRHLYIAHSGSFLPDLEYEFLGAPSQGSRFPLFVFEVKLKKE